MDSSSAWVLAWNYSLRCCTVASLACLALAILYNASIWIYNIFLHPLRSFPGPFPAGASQIPIIRNSLKGREIEWIVSLHKQYGDVVRVAPNELSFNGPTAVKDIYGHRKDVQLTKDPKFYEQPGQNVHHIVNSSDADHSRQRRVFAYAFSDRALRAQEGLFQSHVTKLVKRVQDGASPDNQNSLDLVKLYSYTTFDVMGDLVFGESLGMLDTTEYHPWVSAIISQFHLGSYLHAIRRYPWIESLLMRLIPAEVKRKHELHDEFCAQRVDERLTKTSDRADIWGLVMAKEGTAIGLSRPEMYANAGIFMIAGTETTSTALCGITFYLLRETAVLEKLVQEMRSYFQSQDEITFEALAKLPYLDACVHEGIRLYPSISNGLPRIVGAPGAIVCGHFVPTGARIYATQFAVNCNESNFRNPDQFCPERWQRDDGGDVKTAFQPFSAGPRMCLGRNMAFLEMKLILSRLLYSFDLTLEQESLQWRDQKTYIMWDKGPLKVRAQRARHG